MQSDAKAQAQLEQLARLRRDLEALRDKNARATTATLVIGVLALAAFSAYFVIGYRQINEAANPDMLVAAADDMIEANLPELRKTAADEITKSAPQFAATASKHIQDSIPEVRKKLEAYALDHMDATLKESQLLSEKEFAEYVHANRGMLEEKFKELSAHPKLAEGSLDEVVKSVEQRYATNIKGNAEEALHTITAINEKLERLKQNKDLTKDEQLERRILMTIRRLQTEQIEPQAKSLAESGKLPETLTK